MTHPVDVSSITREADYRLPGRQPTCTVAIPVRNEARRIGACLDAMHEQHVDTDAFDLLLLLNGCTDASWERALDALTTWQRPWRVVDGTLRNGLNHAGGARAAVLRMALDGGARTILTTDADSLVGTDWIALNLAVLGDCDVVAGEVDIRHDDGKPLPGSLVERRQIEAIYAGLLDEIEACCDPLEHDPWPNHRTRSGATLGFRADALAALPTWPTPPCGEDRALVAALAAHGARVRHDTGIRVRTSARLVGRARGGMADTLKRRLQHDDAPCDPMLEAVHDLVVRVSARARAREAFETGMPPHHLAMHLGMLPGRLTDEPCLHFGQAWQWIEQNVSDLSYRPLMPAALPVQIELARQWLSCSTTHTRREAIA